MDADGFDTLTKSLRSRLSRREAIGPIAGVSALLGLAQPEVALARCGKKKPCPECKACKKGKCKPAHNGQLCANTTGVCENGRCQCGELKYCASTHTCGNCCEDRDCGPCAFCDASQGRNKCWPVGKFSCGLSEECSEHVCDPTTNDWICRNKCCDTLAGEEGCGRDCCNSFLGQTCCANKFCCNDDETCIGEKCVLKHCTGTPPTCPPCHRAKCVNPSPNPSTPGQYSCDFLCTGLDENCYDGQCAVCPSNQSKCFMSGVGHYACCRAGETCTACGCCPSQAECCPSGICCQPGQCVPDQPACYL